MPYSDCPDHAFWKLCLEDRRHLIGELYRPKFQISAKTRIATAGSCFAQYFGKYVKKSNLVFHDAEPPPEKMPENVAHDYGYGLFSARYGNIYTVRQLRQLIEDGLNATLRETAIWKNDGKVVDGLRPTIEKHGYQSTDELRKHRYRHLRSVIELFSECEIFVFTLGLTEAWQDIRDGTVFPVAPGSVAGLYDSNIHDFVNFSIFDISNDLHFVVETLSQLNPALKIILTVSPVPLTATATGKHIAQATTYSKSALRAVAEQCVLQHDNVDYFPSFEIITSPIFQRNFYEPNMRSVSRFGVETVMQVFFDAHRELHCQVQGENFPTQISGGAKTDQEIICEEIVLEEFVKK